PDIESEQWTTGVAAGAPSVVLRKLRRGDRDVEIDFPDLGPWRGRQPVLVDDIASSGRTLVEACKGLEARGFAPPICLVVHPLFAEDAYDRLMAVAGRVVSTDTVPHRSNGVSIAPLLAEALQR
ncbi:MAG TPA: phosphoribosyltransferase family protein, partial [Phenylobacterium sp.]|nr:phosphoribosyltransferase family protein [Phenylobacterium sp.]